MKKIIVLLLVICCSFSSVYARKKLEITPKDSIVFEQKTYNFGVIKKGSDGTCEFKFKNKGKAPLVLKNVIPSCGCTGADWTKTPIPSGEWGVIKVKYNTNHLGIFNKSVSVFSNASNSTEILYINGRVDRK